MSNNLVIHSTDTAIDTFIQNQLSERTRQAYRSDLRHFKAFIDRPVREVDAAVLIEYRNMTSSLYSQSTVNRRLSTIRSLFQWLHGNHMIPYNPVQSVKLLPGTDYVKTPGLSDNEALKLLEASKGSPRDHCILAMLLYLGLRRSELVGIHATDLQAERGVSVLTVLGKGSKTRRVPIPAQLEVIISKHISVNVNGFLRAREDVKVPLFGQRRDPLKPIHPETVRKLVRKYCRRAGIKEVSPHSLRTTATSNAIDQGCNFVELQYAMGWSSSEMVKRYDRRRSEIKNSAVWKINYGENK